jgi:hypothetical protein
MDDLFKLDRIAVQNSLYGDTISGLSGFKKFLSLVNRPNHGLLPT